MQKQVAYFDNLVDSFRINHHSQEPISPHFEILKFEDISWQTKETTTNPFRLNAFVIGFVTGGSFKLNISNQEYAIGKDIMYFTSPWHIRQYSEITDWNGYLVFFTPDFIFQYPQGEFIFREFRFFHTENGLVIDKGPGFLDEQKELLDLMYKILHSDNPEKMKMLFHYLNIFLYQCKAKFGSETAQQQNGKDTTLNNFLQTLNEYFIKLNKGKMDKALTLKYVANEMHLHPTYLSNLLKQQTGKTAAQLVRERVILEAQSLLKNTDMTVAEVAYYLHFKDNSNFAKFFRHQVGISPSDYRDKARNNVKI
ncbi:helix-turn-helix transcriptional regulator [Flavihumibacter rivuli]|uniref:helix-turn-helix domain-containing protein n=1 Tax=Flavihumibacter rivuli TaxID=2838156 RepID=UPI001BDEE793|nr:helix-turn-helix transcriptional regulator [Flavihumibacter rivuli]ULQ55648.1 helix-turn-helix transcriptional regulator [Flavihumibacter rivuli]